MFNFQNQVKSIVLVAALASGLTLSTGAIAAEEIKLTVLSGYSAKAS